jgi:hypothetical protein
MLMCENVYLSDRRVRIWVGTTHTRKLVGKIYPHDITIYHVIKSHLS